MVDLARINRDRQLEIHHALRRMVKELLNFVRVGKCFGLLHDGTDDLVLTVACKRYAHRISLPLRRRTRRDLWE